MTPEQQTAQHQYIALKQRNHKHIRAIEHLTDLGICIHKSTYSNEWKLLHLLAKSYGQYVFVRKYKLSIKLGVTCGYLTQKARAILKDYSKGYPLIVPTEINITSKRMLSNNNTFESTSKGSLKVRTPRTSSIKGKYK
ncbi:hypothetical protein KP803_19075 [Vibrio sp. ZSDE26]|uniref:Uncharacterized protein n=1 Tax=Vibrio amylolyticus TaxID=2847292 RepID=A0A9X2BMX1_9VIBR|nr:hypothetical protein [Vibrio amylolyticus]MCK6265373.1 hypothetical protein [Vibrio amylolyticus]